MNFGRMGAGVGRMGRFGGMRPAARLLAGEASGAAFDFVNMDMMIRGGGLDWSGDPNLKLTYTSPSTKWVRNASGVYVSGTTLRTDYLANGTALGLLIQKSSLKTRAAISQDSRAQTAMPIWAKVSLPAKRPAALAA